MIKKVQQICKDINNSPKSLNRLGQILQIISNITNLQHQIKAITQLIDVFKILSNKKIFETTNYQINKFLIDKLNAFTEIILLFISCQNNSQNYQLLYSLIQSTQNQFKQSVLNTIFNKITQQNQINWQYINNGQLITGICKKILQFETYNYKSCVSFLLNGSSLQQIDCKSTIIQLKTESQNMKQLKQYYQRALLKVLNETTQQNCKINIYRGLGIKVFSKLSNPLILSQHLLEVFREDPSLQIQVLSSLFLLVGKYGLDLQGFYIKLQKLITKKSIYSLPNSKRFFKLLESSLKSSRVPLKTISKFSQIIIQQIFEEESQFAFWGLSFIINLVKKHRQLLQLIKGIPEINLLKYHYSDKIRKLVKMLDANLNKIQYLELQTFSSLKCKKIIDNKIAKLQQKLNENEVIFLIPPNYEPL